ncbi:LOW QUALITY PROTEIN: hypothetical protein YC2023_045545 [Brassica napus]
MTHPKTACRAPQRNAHTNISNSSGATHPQHPNRAIIRPGNGLYTAPNRAKWAATSAIPNQSPNLHTTAPHTTTRGSIKPMKCWDRRPSVRCGDQRHENHHTPIAVENRRTEIGAVRTTNCDRKDGSRTRAQTNPTVPDFHNKLKPATLGRDN